MRWRKNGALFIVFLIVFVKAQMFEEALCVVFGEF